MARGVRCGSPSHRFTRTRGRSAWTSPRSARARRCGERVRAGARPEAGGPADRLGVVRRGIRGALGDPARGGLHPRRELLLLRRRQSRRMVRAALLPSGARLRRRADRPLLRLQPRAPGADEGSVWALPLDPASTARMGGPGTLVPTAGLRPRRADRPTALSDGRRSVRAGRRALRGDRLLPGAAPFLQRPARVFRRADGGVLAPHGLRVLARSAAPRNVVGLWDRIRPGPVHQTQRLLPALGAGAGGGVAGVEAERGESGGSRAGAGVPAPVRRGRGAVRLPVDHPRAAAVSRALFAPQPAHLPVAGAGGRQRDAPQEAEVGGRTEPPPAGVARGDGRARPADPLRHLAVSVAPPGGANRLVAPVSRHPRPLRLVLPRAALEGAAVSPRLRAR